MQAREVTDVLPTGIGILAFANPTRPFDREGQTSKTISREQKRRKEHADHCKRTFHYIYENTPNDDLKMDVELWNTIIEDNTLLAMCITRLAEQSDNSKFDEYRNYYPGITEAIQICTPRLMAGNFNNHSWELLCQIESFCEISDDGIRYELSQEFERIFETLYMPPPPRPKGGFHYEDIATFVRDTFVEFAFQFLEHNHIIKLREVLRVLGCEETGRIRFDLMFAAARNNVPVWNTMHPLNTLWRVTPLTPLMVAAYSYLSLNPQNRHFGQFTRIQSADALDAILMNPVNDFCVTQRGIRGNTNSISDLFSRNAKPSWTSLREFLLRLGVLSNCDRATISNLYMQRYLYSGQYWIELAPFHIVDTNFHAEIGNVIMDRANLSAMISYFKHEIECRAGGVTVEEEICVCIAKIANRYYTRRIGPPDDVSCTTYKQAITELVTGQNIALISKVLQENDQDLVFPWSNGCDIYLHLCSLGISVSINRPSSFAAFIQAIQRGQSIKGFLEAGLCIQGEVRHQALAEVYTLRESNEKQEIIKLLNSTGAKIRPIDMATALRRAVTIDGILDTFSRRYRSGMVARAQTLAFYANSCNEHVPRRICQVIRGFAEIMRIVEQHGEHTELYFDETAVAAVDSVFEEEGTGSDSQSKRARLGGDNPE